MEIEIATHRCAADGSLVADGCYVMAIARIKQMPQVWVTSEMFPLEKSSEEAFDAYALALLNLVEMLRHDLSFRNRGGDRRFVARTPEYVVPRGIGPDDVSFGRIDERLREMAGGSLRVLKDGIDG